MAQYGSNYPYGKSLYKDDGPLPEFYTCMDIIKRALRLLGVTATGETPDSIEMQDAFRELNWMLDSWSTTKVLTPCLTDLLFPTKAYQGTYTIGRSVAANFMADRPLRIEKAFFRRYQETPIPIDYPINIINNTQWTSIVMKGLQNSWPIYMNYVMTPMPLGTINVWPVPTIDGALGMAVWSQMGTFNSIQDQVTLPPGYLDAIAYNLAIEIAPEYGQEASPTIQRKAMNMKRDLSAVNTEEVILTSDTPRQVPYIYRIEADGYVA